EVKGVEYALRAVALVKRKHPGVRHVVAGGGAPRGGPEALGAGVGGAGKGRFFGAAPRGRAPRPRPAGARVVLPPCATAGGGGEGGEEENQPVSVAEAQASGLPVVATAIGGVAESVRDGETGLLVPPRDPEALAAAILRLIEQPDECARMGRAGRRLAEGQYDAEMLHDRLEAVYRKCMGPSRAASNRDIEPCRSSK